MKVDKLIFFSSVFFLSIKLSLIGKDFSYTEYKEMMPILENWYAGISKTADESYAKYELDKDKSKIISDYMQTEPQFRALTAQPYSYKVRELIVAEDKLSHYIIYLKNGGKFSNLTEKSGNYILRLPVCRDHIVIISSKWLRTVSHMENLGLVDKNNLTSQEIADINADMKNSKTFQHLSRAYGHEIFEKIKELKKCIHLKTPKTYILKFPWFSKVPEISDETACIVQELVEDLKPIDREFAKSLDKDIVRELYEMAKCAAVWDLYENIFHDGKGNIYFIDLEKHSKTKTYSYTLFDMQNPLHIISCAVRSLSKYFPKDTYQFQYLVELIKEDKDLRDEAGNAKLFQKTLLTAVGAS